MDDKPVIKYLNTDLDLLSSVPLASLAEELESFGVWVGHVTAGDDGLWYAMFEMRGE